MNSDEPAFYDAVARNESAVHEMGVNVLADIARDLVRTLRRDVTTDWVSRDDVQARIREPVADVPGASYFPAAPVRSC